ncbi:hypothetical protein [Escherichia phage PJNS034]
MLRIFNYNNGSQGLGALREHVEPLIREMNTHRGFRNIRPVMGSENGSARLFQATNRFIMNWGSSQPLNTDESNFVLNKPEAVGLATHKLRFFQHVHQWNQEKIAQGVNGLTVPIPEWTTSRDEAQTWAGHDHLVYARQRLQGHSGEGIEVYGINQVVERAPLYTKGIIGARREYRVHVIAGQVALVQLKKRRNGGEAVGNGNDHVRNLGSGWVYAVSDARPSPVVLSAAQNAVRALGLDFGAVDIIAKGRKGQERECWVLEVNTAPGQRGDTTVTLYARAVASAYAIWMNRDSVDVRDLGGVKAAWETLPWLNDETFLALMRDEGADGSVLLRSQRETQAAEAEMPNTDDDVAADENFALPADELTPARATSGAHVVHTGTRWVDVEAAPQVRAEPVRRRDGEPMPFNGNPFDARIRREPAPRPAPEPVVMPERRVMLSRLGQNDPQNEQFVVFTWNGRREVGVVNTRLGVVYMAGSEVQLPLAQVDLIAVVDTEIR